MNRLGCLFSALMVGLVATSVAAESPQDEIRNLRKSLRTLDWAKVDFNALDKVQQCRSYALLEHALTEIGAVATAEADLMSQYLEEKGLGDEFRDTPVDPSTRVRTYEEGQKMAAALLQGPMASSKYATMFEGSDEISLNSTCNLHAKASKRKWEKFTAPIQFVKGMAKFLTDKNQFEDYQVWAGEESERRQDEHKQEMADRAKIAKANKAEAEEERIARAKQLEEERREREESRMAQQALYAQSMAAMNASNDEDDDDDHYYDWFPGRYRRYPGGGHPVQPWHRDKAKQDNSSRRTQDRMKSWNKSSGGAKRGGGGGRRR